MEEETESEMEGQCGERGVWDQGGARGWGKVAPNYIRDGA